MDTANIVQNINETLDAGGSFASDTVNTFTGATSEQIIAVLIIIIVLFFILGGSD